MTDRPLAGRTALITGAAGGIGHASVLRFAAAGARVYAFDRSEAVHEATLEALFTELGIAVPATYDEFKAAVAKIKEAGYVPIAFGNYKVGKYRTFALQAPAALNPAAPLPVFQVSEEE